MTETDRPDPDELLSRITAEESEAERGSRGRLKIFFGACAGVGKTYAMLSAAQSALKDKVDVVIGVVETHGREDTMRLAEGIPVIEPRSIQYRSTILKEFDIDAALARKPDLILLDELAHTNAPGSRHPKRWQDVEEMLEAGIDVYSTLNVQHLESLNDVVARITSVWVKETVPDALFDAADEISLVDIPSEDLLKRLKEGKVYIAPGAKRRAAQNFFRKGNLIALRELALRRTAERVDAQMDKYKTRTGSLQGWSGGERIVVCIGPDPLSTRLVRAAKRMAGSLRAPWTAVYIENERHYRLSKEGQEAVERTLRLAERMGGKTEIVQGGRAADELIKYARAHGMTKIVVGKSSQPRWREIIYGTLADHIIRRSGDIDVYVVTGGVNQEEAKPTRAPFWQFPAGWTYYASGPVAAAISTLVLMPIRALAESFNLSAIYLVAIVTVAVQFGRIPAVVTTILSAVAFNYYIVQPYYTFKLEDERQLITFVVLLLAGILIGAQTSRLRLQAKYARLREQNTHALYAMTRELTGNRGKDTLLEIVARHIGEVVNSHVSVWIPDAKAQLAKTFDDYESQAADIDPLREESAARWAFSHKQVAGRGTETLPSASGYYMPLLASGGAVGVLGLFRQEEGFYNSEQTGLLETFTTIAASALERANAAELMEKTMVETESEKLRNILLSSVSHDLRTPLAGITGAASTLLLEGQKITDEYRDELLRLVHEEAARLARMVTNLLDVTSLQTGSVRLNKELYFIEELIGSALMRAEPRLGARKVTTRIEHGLPLMRMDGLLIEQVLINLLENVTDHTPEDTQVTIAAQLVKPNLHVIISDNGPGLPEGDEERIFDRFYSDDKESVDGAPVSHHDGGLGLAICRGIIKAHGGNIWAENNPTKGATFTFTLPVRTQDADNE